MRPSDYEHRTAKALPEAEIHFTDETVLGNLHTQHRKTRHAIVVVKGEPVAVLPFTAAGYEVGIDGVSKIRLECHAGGAAFDTRGPVRPTISEATLEAIRRGPRA